MIASTKCLLQEKLVHFNSRPIGHCRHFVKRYMFQHTRKRRPLLLVPLQAIAVRLVLKLFEMINQKFSWGEAPANPKKNIEHVSN
jgi:hypothetical protein